MSVMPLFIFGITFLFDLELNSLGKLVVFRWELIVPSCCRLFFLFFFFSFFSFFFFFFFFVVKESLSRENQADIIEALSSTSRFFKY